MLAMGLLAWLMLVTNVGAAPMGMPGMPHAQLFHATVAAVSGHCHHQADATTPRTGDDDQDGCGGTTGHACHCGVMCSSTLVPTSATDLVSAVATIRYAMPLPRSAPSVDNAPPLRPPAV
jgi:hypothetical protein